MPEVRWGDAAGDRHREPDSYLEESGEGILSFFMLTPFWSKSRMIAHLCRNCEIVVLEYGTAG